MNQLLNRPLSNVSDLGKPIPAWPHATSVCMPKWQHNIGYEERTPAVTAVMQCGYPRFVYHPYVRNVFERGRTAFSGVGESCMVFPSRRTAVFCRDFLRQKGAASSVRSFGDPEVFAVVYPDSLDDHARQFWQHTGEGISSRLALAVLENRGDDDDPAARTKIKETIGRYTNVDSGSVYVFPTGMSAIFNVHTCLRSMLPDAKTIQFGFSYVDTLKLQQKFGPGTHFFPGGTDQELDAVEDLLKRETIAGIFCEVPMNPLLKSPDMERLSQLARLQRVPLVVDDTIATYINVNLAPYADIVVSSLTKFFSGVGDVMAGAAVLNEESPLYDIIKPRFESSVEDNLWGADAGILERNSRDFVSRVHQINRNAERLADFLVEMPQVEQLYYPKFQTPALYRALLREGGGYSGVMSIALRSAEVHAPSFFDALAVSKGPSLGTNFTLACPYTILAHYTELDFAERCGVSRYLIRVSVGLEDYDILQGRFERAFDALG